MKIIRILIVRIITFCGSYYREDEKKCQPLIRQTHKKTAERNQQLNEKMEYEKCYLFYNVSTHDFPIVSSVDIRMRISILWIKFFQIFFGDSI